MDASNVCQMSNVKCVPNRFINVKYVLNNQTFPKAQRTKALSTMNWSIAFTLLKSFVQISVTSSRLLANIWGKNTPLEPSVNCLMSKLRRKSQSCQYIGANFAEPVSRWFKYCLRFLCTNFYFKKWFVLKSTLETEASKSFKILVKLQLC